MDDLKFLSFNKEFRINPLPQLSMPLWKRPFENIVDKGEYASKQHFLFFPKCCVDVVVEDNNDIDVVVDGDDET